MKHREADRLKVVRLARAGFMGHPRPAMCMSHGDDCPECRDHETSLSGKTRDTLVVEDLGTVAWNPLAHMKPSAMAFFLPTIIRLAVDNVPDADGEPFACRFINLVLDGPNDPRFRFFVPPERRAVVHALEFIREYLAEVVESEGWGGELDAALGRWRCE
ncbi:MAG: hypothetical protein ACLFOY_17485 [Desulfatibacillaceae bacterium]